MAEKRLLNAVWTGGGRKALLQCDTLALVNGRQHRDWDEFARREPYFAVLTDRRFLRNRIDSEARRHFFETGESDVEQLLAAITEYVGRGYTPASALDFGCGVGRLTLALARRIPRVIGCDISPEMIAEAKENATAAGIANATFVPSLDEIADQKFDLICSIIVFQHIPVTEGLSTLSTLLQLLSPGGVAALHFTLRRPGWPLRRLARRLRAAMPLLHHTILRLEGDRLRLPYMQMNTYNERTIVRRIVKATGRQPRMIPRVDGDVEGAIFLVQRPS